MSWLAVAIWAYSILAIVFLIDKHLLTERIPNPKLYAFYAGIFGALIVLLIPFVDFEILSAPYFLLAVAAGGSFFIALFLFYTTLKNFEVSRVVPAIGALIPIFSLALAYGISGGRETLSSYEIMALALLVAGSFLINYKKGKTVYGKSFLFSALTSMFFSLHFILAKYLYIAHSFWNGIIWLNLGGFLMAVIFFLAFKAIRNEVLFQRKTFKKKTALIFFSSKILAGLGGLLQNFAIFLAPSVAVVAIINALQGTQYAFLLLIAVFLSLKYPHIIKEEISKNIITQKVLSIMLIAAGLALLSTLNS